MNSLILNTGSLTNSISYLVGMGENLGGRYYILTDFRLQWIVTDSDPVSSPDYFREYRIKRIAWKR